MVIAKGGVSWKYSKSKASKKKESKNIKPI
jgi:hypothetical protein